MGRGGGGRFTMTSKFRSGKSFEERKELSGRILEKYSDRVPVIVEKYNSTEPLPDLEKSKFLAPSVLLVGQFVHQIRSRIELSADQSLFVFCQDTIPNTTQTMGEVYKRFKDDDGFLYMTYTSMSTFG